MREDRTPHSADEMDYVRHRTTVDGIEAGPLTREVNAKFHAGLPVRTVSAIRMMRTKHGWLINRNPAEAAPTQAREQEVKREETADGLTVLAVGQRIRTVDELAAHIQLDRAKYEIHEPQATSWDVTVRDPVTGDTTTVQNHRVAFKARLKAGPDLREQVEAIIGGAFARRAARLVAKTKPRDGLLQVVGIFDPHIAKHAWNKETAHGDYDTSIGVATLRAANADLIAKGDAKKPSARWILLGGDFFHHDGQGATTKGTPLDYDSRVQKMIDEGSRALFDIIDWSAATCPTHIVLVPGNHDAVLSWALQRILQSHFRATKGVTVDGTFTSRKYLRWGKCLLGLTHGDKGWKRLPALMSREAAFEWGQTTLRHIHHGHLHSKRQVDTVDGVTVFQHPALCPPDGWHAREGFVSDRAQESYYYHTLGALVGMDAYSPDLAQPVRRGVAA